MSETSIPDTAVFFPFYPAVALARLQFIEDAKAGVEQYNREARSAYKNACENWTASGILARERLITILPPKPIAPRLKVQHAEFDAANALYLWATLEGPVGPPCPDLPPLLVLASGTVSIGRNVAPDYWAALPDDTAPAGHTFTVPPAIFNVPPGEYRKVRSPFGTSAGWYQKIG